MIAETKNYENEDFGKFIASLNRRQNISGIYGRYEYSVTGFFRHFYQEVAITYQNDETIYEGWVDENGHVSLTENSRNIGRTVRVYRRDTSSLNDEILRFAEYFRYWAVVIYNHARKLLHNDNQKGYLTNKHLPEIVNTLEPYINNPRINTDPLFCIYAGKKARFFSMNYLNIKHPWLDNGDPLWYVFFDNVSIGPEERAFINGYKKKKGDDYWIEREGLHFKYLEEQAQKMHLDYGDVSTTTAEADNNVQPRARNPLRTFWFVVSCVALILFPIVAMALASNNAPNAFYPFLLSLPCLVLGLPIYIVKLNSYRRYIASNGYTRDPLVTPSLFFAILVIFFGLIYGIMYPVGYALFPELKERHPVSSVEWTVIYIAAAYFLLAGLLTIIIKILERRRYRAGINEQARLSGDYRFETDGDIKSIDDLKTAKRGDSLRLRNVSTGRTYDYRFVDYFEHVGDYYLIVSYNKNSTQVFRINFAADSLNIAENGAIDYAVLGDKILISK